jgi:serine/threonine-protein kinase
MDSDPANQLFCTPEYVAPEVASGDQAIDFRSDIYSLGAAFFRLISGYPPFKGQDNSSTIVQRFNGSPDLRSYCDVNRALAELILKMMSLSADERHQSYDELIQETEHTITTLNKETQYYIQGLEDLPHVE